MVYIYNRCYFHNGYIILLYNILNFSNTFIILLSCKMVNIQFKFDSRLCIIITSEGNYDDIAVSTRVVHYNNIEVIIMVIIIIIPSITCSVYYCLVFTIITK